MGKGTIMTHGEPTRIVAGAMSGTSADGVDVAITAIQSITGRFSAHLLLHHHRPYAPAVRAAIFAARSGRSVTLSGLAELGRDISLVYAAAVNEALLAAGLSAPQLACVAAHGQTLFHKPPLTMQWLDPALLAAETGCTVVSDFRRADCAAGGQGAPLVPLADIHLFGHPTKRRVLVNIGGIANFTYLPAGPTVTNAMAMDSGPGNCISDLLMRQADPDGPGFDQAGQRAADGMPIPGAVAAMLGSVYFQQPPPKSTDGPAMIALFREHLGNDLERYKLVDLLATACQLTAWSLADAIKRFCPAPPDELFISGGGIENQAIMRYLTAAVGNLPIIPTDRLGVASQSKEALAFALLGLWALDNQPGNVPAATGARRPVVLGSITPRP